MKRYKPLFEDSNEDKEKKYKKIADLLFAKAAEHGWIEGTLSGIVKISKQDIEKIAKKFKMSFSELMARPYESWFSIVHIRSDNSYAILRKPPLEDLLPKN